mmetsp:Transcript_189/g.706  ORF Transcript_189/g.706 Transcript_189/m.706 type:complete len:216 (+) Transcript_189:1340-1987(+)
MARFDETSNVKGPKSAISYRARGGRIINFTTDLHADRNRRGAAASYLTRPSESTTRSTAQPLCTSTSCSSEKREDRLRADLIDAPRRCATPSGDAPDAQRPSCFKASRGIACRSISSKAWPLNASGRSRVPKRLAMANVSAMHESQSFAASAFAKARVNVSSESAFEGSRKTRATTFELGLVEESTASGWSGKERIVDSVEESCCKRKRALSKTR